MNKILSFFNSRLMCAGGGRSASTRNKQFREEELLLISDVKSNFNSQINLRDKNIGGGANCLRVRLESKHKIFSLMKEVKAI